MPKTAEQNEKIREATRAAILSSAMSLFAQQGYAHTTIRKIAEEANISVGLIYHYFESKESLLRAVFEHAMRTLSEDFAVAMESNEAGRRVAPLLRIIFDLLESDRDFWALFYMMRTQPAVVAILGDSLSWWTAQLRDIFAAELQAAGRQDPDLDAYLLYSLIEGTIQQYLLDPDEYPLAAVTGRIVAQYGS